MTIALVSGRNAQATGVDRYVGGLSAGLRAFDVDVRSFEIVRRELRVGPVRFGGLLSVWQQRAMLKTPGANLVHCLDPAAAVHHADVVTVHDLIPETHPQWAGAGVMGRVDWALNRYRTKKARHIIAVSHATRDEIVRRWSYDPERITVVHHGIDAERFRRADVAAANGSDDDVRTLIYVGDDNPRKNLDLAVGTLIALARRHGVRARLVRVGPTRFPADAARRRDRAAQAGVELREVGFVPDEALAGLIGSADAFLWPTRVEGFGFPPLEAMACGTPVVALDTPINREIIGALGRFHADDADAAADAVAAVLADPPASDAIMRHAHTFTWAKTARETWAVYESLGGVA